MTLGQGWYTGLVITLLRKSMRNTDIKYSWLFMSSITLVEDREDDIIIAPSQLFPLQKAGRGLGSRLGRRVVAIGVHIGNMLYTHN